MEHYSFPDTSIPLAYGPYSHAVVAGDFVFLAGQIARDPVSGHLIEGDIEAQTARCLEIVSDILISLGLSLAGREMELTFESGSQVAEFYGLTSAREEYYCNFGVNPGKVGLLRNSGLRISGSDSEGEVRVIELPNHPFYLGTLFVPQTRSTERQPHPLVTAFVQAVAAAPGQL